VIKKGKKISKQNSNLRLHTQTVPEPSEELSEVFDFEKIVNDERN
jgi:hypothetical protein